MNERDHTVAGSLPPRGRRVHVYYALRGPSLLVNVSTGSHSPSAGETLAGDGHHLGRTSSAGPSKAVLHTQYTRLLALSVCVWRARNVGTLVPVCQRLALKQSQARAYLRGVARHSADALPKPPHGTSSQNRVVTHKSSPPIVALIILSTIWVDGPHSRPLFASSDQSSRGEPWCERCPKSRPVGAVVAVTHGQQWGETASRVLDPTRLWRREPDTLPRSP